MISRLTIYNPEPLQLATIQLNLFKIGAHVVHHARAITFKLAEVAVTDSMINSILKAIDRLRSPPQRA